MSKSEKCFIVARTGGGVTAVIRYDAIASVGISSNPIAVNVMMLSGSNVTQHFENAGLAQAFIDGFLAFVRSEDGASD